MVAVIIHATSAVSTAASGIQSSGLSGIMAPEIHSTVVSSMKMSHFFLNFFIVFVFLCWQILKICQLIKNNSLFT